MPRFSKILFPIDFSKRCRQVAPIVAAWARHFDVPVVLIHSFDVPYGEREFAALQAGLRKQVRAAAETAVRDFAGKEFRSGVRLETLVEEGDPGKVVLGVSQQTPGALVMLPTHGRSGFRRFLVGSVTGKILHDVECPVWTTPHADSMRGLKRKAPGTILCAVDRTRSAVSLIRWAEWLAGEYGAVLKLVHALPAVDEDSTNRGERAVRRHWETRARQQLGPIMVEAGCKAELLLEGGNVPEALAASAAGQRADLLIIGRGQTRKRFGRLRTHSLGIISKSPCPVLSV